MSVQLWEKESLVVMDRIRSLAGIYVTQASLTSITCKVYDGDSVVASPTVTISSAISDTLVTADNGVRWKVDAIGYNFIFTMTGSTCFPQPDKKYLVEIILLSTTGHYTSIVFTVPTKPLKSL